MLAYIPYMDPMGSSNVFKHFLELFGLVEGMKYYEIMCKPPQVDLGQWFRHE